MRKFLILQMKMYGGILKSTIGLFIFRKLFIETPNYNRLIENQSLDFYQMIILTCLVLEKC